MSGRSAGHRWLLLSTASRMCRVAASALQALMSGHDPAHQHRDQDRARPAQSAGRRPWRQRREARCGARRGCRRRRRPRPLHRAVHHRLSARGPRAQAGVRGCGAGARGGAGRRDGRRRPRRHRRHDLAGGGQALQFDCAARRRPGGGAAPQGRSAQLRRLRREARVRRRPNAGAGQLPRRAPRRADLRGHLEGRGHASACRRPARRSCSCPTARRSTGPSPTCA